MVTLGTDNEQSEQEKTQDNALGAIRIPKVWAQDLSLYVEFSMVCTLFG